MRKKARRDFTLIELLIVIVILGILAAIVVFAVQNLTSSSSQASCGSDYKTVETAVEAYKAQLGDYPGGPNISAAWTLQPSPATAIPTGYTGTASTMQALLGTAVATGTPANTVGPWLKDVPYNPGHYEIDVATITGNVTVSPAAAVGSNNPCSGAT